MKSQQRIESDKLDFKSCILNLLNSQVSVEEIQGIFDETIQTHKNSTNTLNNEYECNCTCIATFDFTILYLVLIYIYVTDECIDIYINICIFI